MMRRVRSLLFILLAAVAGAIAGRVAAEVRRRQEAGEPLDLTLDDLRFRAQDVVPGVVAAVRVQDAPWSWLHIPAWLAAFGVNLGVGAVGGDLSHVREMAERAVFGFAGIELPDDEEPAAAPAYEVVPEDPAAPPPPPPTPPPPSMTWTDARPAERADEESRGFTAFTE